MNTFTVNVVRVNGEIDVNATLTEVHAELAKLAITERANFDEIAAAVESVFQDHPGQKSMQVGVVVQYALNKLKFAMSEFESIQEQVKNYIRSATDTYYIMRGKGGGVLYLPRLDPKELAKVNEQRAKAAQSAAAKNAQKNAA